MAYKTLVIKGKKYTFRNTFPEDRSELELIWKNCFGDTQEFIDFFFSERFFPDYSYCVLHEGKIAACMHSMPVTLIVRGSEIPGAIVSGVCTLEEHRGEGLMRSMFREYTGYIRDKGILALTYKPENPEVYKSLSHYTCTSTLKYIAPKAFPSVIRSPVHPDLVSSVSRDNPAGQTDPEINQKEVFYSGKISDMNTSLIERCHILYSLMAPSYSGIIKRSKEDFFLKVKDYQSSGGKFIVMSSDSHVCAYCFYFDKDNSVYGEELISDTDTAVLKMLDRLHEIANGKKLSVKIPSNFTQIPEGNFPDSNCVSLIDQNITGVTDIGAFIAAIDFSANIPEENLEKFIFEITDPCISCNNGIFNLTGRETKNKPVIKTDTGSFVRFLCGYYSISDLETHTPDLVKIYDRDICTEIDDTILCCDCFLPDEY